MQPVRDAEGDQYLLERAGEETWLVRDPETGERRHLPASACERVDAAPLETAAAGVRAPTRRLLTAVHDERALGLVCTIVDAGPTAVRTLLAETTYCESDLHGVLAELRAAGLLAETTVAGERGYEPTEAATAAVADLRD